MQICIWGEECVRHKAVALANNSSGVSIWKVFLDFYYDNFYWNCIFNVSDHCEILLKLSSRFSKCTTQLIFLIGGWAFNGNIYLKSYIHLLIETHTLEYIIADIFIILMSQNVRFKTLSHSNVRAISLPACCHSCSPHANSSSPWGLLWSCFVATPSSLSVSQLDHSYFAVSSYSFAISRMLFKYCETGLFHSTQCSGDVLAGMD